MNWHWSPQCPITLRPVALPHISPPTFPTHVYSGGLDYLTILYLASTGYPFVSKIKESICVFKWFRLYLTGVLLLFLPSDQSFSSSHHLPLTYLKVFHFHFNSYYNALDFLALLPTIHKYFLLFLVGSPQSSHHPSTWQAPGMTSLLLSTP